MLNQHKILRVLQLITYLQSKPHKSIDQLSQFLTTTERTVYRYLDLLRECGFDLHKDSSQRYYIEKGDGEILIIKDFDILVNRSIVVIQIVKIQCRHNIFFKST